METIQAEAVADGQARLSSAKVISKVILPDSSNSTFFKNAGLSTRSLKPLSVVEQALLEELAAQKQKKLLSLENLLRSRRGVKQQRKRCWRPNNCMTKWRSDKKRTISSFRESCRQPLLVSLLSPDPIITSGVCGFWTILVVWWTICCVMVNYISVVCSYVMNYMWL